MSEWPTHLPAHSPSASVAHCSRLVSIPASLTAAGVRYQRRSQRHQPAVLTPPRPHRPTWTWFLTPSRSAHQGHSPRCRAWPTKPLPPHQGQLSRCFETTRCVEPTRWAGLITEFTSCIEPACFIRPLQCTRCSKPTCRICLPSESADPTPAAS